MTPGYPATGAQLRHHVIPRTLPYTEMGIALGRLWRASSTRSGSKYSHFVNMYLVSLTHSPVVAGVVMAGDLSQSRFSLPVTLRCPMSSCYPQPFKVPWGAAARTSCCWLFWFWPWSSIALSSPPGCSTVQRHQNPPGPRPFSKVGTARARSAAGKR